jgi:heme-degrading monooxygenase HmoA
MAEVHYIEWHVTPFRRDAFLEVWGPALDRALAYGAHSSFISRNEDDPLHLRQVTVWESRADHEAWWFSDEISALRQAALSYFHKPVDQHWHTPVAEAALQVNGKPQ